MQGFITNGFVRLDEAFARETAEEGREILWRECGCDPADRTTWTRPVVRLGGYSDAPFRVAASTPRLIGAFDQLIGTGRWLPPHGLGTFPIRFPVPGDPGDTGWHVDASYPPSDNGDQPFSSWRVNVHSNRRALLMLFLFSDVGEFDAPTRIRAGSHFDVARILAPAGEAGMSFMELAQRLDATAGSQEVFATGEAGTVYLCHPFLVHAAQPHRGTAPRFMAQPPLESVEPFQLARQDRAYSPAETAIRMALGLENSDHVER
jgi:hypothetical protein